MKKTLFTLITVGMLAVTTGLLVAEGSRAHDEEVRVLERWRAWGPAARHYHFAARNPDGSCSTTQPSLHEVDMVAFSGTLSF